jgi:hypothetical protein
MGPISNVVYVPTCSLRIEASRSAARAAIRSMYDAEGCGVCEKPGAEVFWFSPFSRGAHASCVKLINGSERELVQRLEWAFYKPNDHLGFNTAHVLAVGAVRKETGSDSLLSFLEKHGSQALKKLFTTVGAKAALVAVPRHDE